MNNIKKTEKLYGFVWEKADDCMPPDTWHFNKMQEVILDSIVKEGVGIDVGSGCGYDTYIMAKNNPLLKIVSMDISDGVYKTKNFVSKLANAYVIKGSALAIPAKRNMFDFAYSFGVLHHTPDPELGLKEIARVLKPGAGAYLYLYEDLAEYPVKYFALKLVNLLRIATTRLSPKILYTACVLLSPVVVILFSWPAKVLKKFEKTRSFSEKIPFNFGTHLFSVAGDLYDRFGAPIEHRFSRKGVIALLERNGFINISISRMESVAGWVAWGYKRND